MTDPASEPEGAEDTAVHGRGEKEGAESEAGSSAGGEVEAGAALAAARVWVGELLHHPYAAAFESAVTRGGDVAEAVIKARVQWPALSAQQREAIAAAVVGEAEVGADGVLAGLRGGVLRATTALAPANSRAPRAGLWNAGHTCGLSAVVQALASCAAVRDASRRGKSGATLS